MARIRSIKPDFFLDEEIGVLHPDAQLLLLGLATLADKEGRLEDRPIRIKASLFPYRDVDVNAHLSTLEGVGQVVRYESDGVRCIALAHFQRDQRPHPKETSHGLPPPPVKGRETSRQGVDASRRVPLVVGSGSSSGDGLDGSGDDPADAVSDSVDELPDATEHAQPALFDSEPAKPKRPKGPDPQALRELWNRVAPPLGYQRWEAMGDDRKRAARLALEACPDLAKWEAWLRHELTRPFNRGENSDGWKANVDWLLRKKTPNLVADFDPSTAKVPTAAAPAKPPVRLIEM